MTEDELSAYAKAAETKKRRTREKLVSAADYVMREDGLSAKVDAIAEEAGVSTPTFYNFYRSRNQLCADALNMLVFEQLKLMEGVPTVRRLRALAEMTRDRDALVTAALIARSEAGYPQVGFKVDDSFLGTYAFLDENADAVDRLAFLLQDHPTALRSGPHYDHKEFSFTLRAIALMLLELIAAGRADDLPSYAGVIDRLRESIGKQEGKNA